MHRYSGRTFALEIAVLLFAIVLMIPFFFLVNVALKGDSDAFLSPAIAPPNPPTVASFVDAWAGSPTGNIPLGLLNSVIVTAGSLVVLIAFGSIAAYTITRIPGRLSTGLYILFLIGIILPFQLGMVPIYVVLRSVGLVGTQLGMIVLYSGLLMPLAVFLYSGFTRSLPREYEEAAQMDGSSRLQTFIRIIFPLLGPATGTVAILAGLIIWNDFFTALIFLAGSKNATLPVVIYGFVGANVSTWNVIFAGIIISMIPILLFYVFAQRKFIQGFAGGIKS
ncbi:carbohydrate ABC transporter permease [Microbacterium trichothecenolyticum]|uniref:carbohydrate ABC transporter permease n=1 Tax=Microbacterium trichothecenolyticum TaxID=69370 RepID=UPI0035BE9B2C